jgi:hypothetical protein
MSAPHPGRVRSVRASTRLAEAQMGPGFSAHGLRHVDGVSLDPFLSVDHFRMSQPTFPPHPHAGFSAVTYMFEDSPGGFINRDSLGDVSRIGPGALHWTQAARGMMHEEIPERRGVEGHGLQMFVNLRADHKQPPPARVPRRRPREVPEVTSRRRRAGPRACRRARRSPLASRRAAHPGPLARRPPGAPARRCHVPGRPRTTRLRARDLAGGRRRSGPAAARHDRSTRTSPPPSRDDGDRARARCRPRRASSCS